MNNYIKIPLISALAVASISYAGVECPLANARLLSYVELSAKYYRGDFTTDRLGVIKRFEPQEGYDYLNEPNTYVISPALFQRLLRSNREDKCEIGSDVVRWVAIEQGPQLLEDLVTICLEDKKFNTVMDLLISYPLRGKDAGARLLQKYVDSLPLFEGLMELTVPFFEGQYRFLRVSTDF